MNLSIRQKKKQLEDKRANSNCESRLAFGIWKVERMGALRQGKVPLFSVNYDHRGTPKNVGNLNLTGGAVNNGVVFHSDLYNGG